MLDAQQLIALLGLEPLEPEGGWFRETWRAPGPGRASSTAIYYLITPERGSALHRLGGSDEVFHFYLGDAVELLLLRPDRTSELVMLGTHLERGERPQIVAPRGTWQGALLAPGGKVALLGTTCAPGFEYADCEFARGDEQRAGWPDREAAIRARLIGLRPGQGKPKQP